MSGYAQQMNSTRGQIFLTAYELLMESTLGSGSQMRVDFNFSVNKYFFSTVLTAMADADYCFILVEVGAYGSSRDSNVF